MGLEDCRFRIVGLVGGGGGGVLIPTGQSCTATPEGEVIFITSLHERLDKLRSHAKYYL